MKYSIWIIPPEPIYSQLKAKIDRLSERYEGPKFEPHMTIVGNIERNPSEIEENIKKIVAGLNKLKLSLGPVSFSTTYFQSVFVRVNSTSKLMQLNLDTKNLLGMENDVFMPHMSLLYGDHDMATREKAAESVKLPRPSFMVDKFVVSTTSGDTKDWGIVATIPIGQ